MTNQIRINKTAEIVEALTVLRSQKYITMNDAEIVKYLIAKDYTATKIPIESLDSESVKSIKIGLEDIKSGRSTLLKSKQDIQKYFKKLDD